MIVLAWQKSNDGIQVRADDAYLVSEIDTLVRS